MREILFRAWLTEDYPIEKDRNKYLYMDDLSIDGALDGVKHGNVVLEQYTGLKDKNGVKIFEGDKLSVKFNARYYMRIDWKGKPDAIATVYWDYNAFRLKCEGKEDSRYADFYDFLDNYEGEYNFVDMELEHTEIIGNIHEKLLKEK